LRQGSRPKAAALKGSSIHESRARIGDSNSSTRRLTVFFDQPDEIIFARISEKSTDRCR
jgi:hypothetical protein